MQKKIRLMMGAAVLAAGALALAGTADAAPHGVKVGTLTCNVASGWGFVFGSSKDLHCTFRPQRPCSEHYTGTISKFGVDIGYTEGGVLVWGVFAPSSDVRAGALAGRLCRCDGERNGRRGPRRKRADRRPRQVDRAAAAQRRRQQGPERRGRHRRDQPEVLRRNTRCIELSESPAGNGGAFCVSGLRRIAGFGIALALCLSLVFPDFGDLFRLAI